MKTMLVLAVTLAGLLALLTGCNKDSTVAPGAQFTDQQVLQQQVVSADSIAQFSASDEATIDDNGLNAPDYDGLAKELALAGVRGVQYNLDSLSAIRWGRHIFHDQITRDYHVVMLGDTGAIVSITKTVPGQLWVGFGSRTADTIVIDTVVKKPFVETVRRNVRFRRIANNEDRMRNWAPVAITLVQGTTDSSAFAVSALEVQDVTRQFDTTVTDPLGTWFRLGLFHGSIPRFTVGDSVIVRVTVTSADDSAETVFLRHSVESGALMRHRARMALVSTSGGPGAYTRVYEKKFSPRMPLDLRAARCNAIVDVFSHGSIASPALPYRNEFWGIPYIVVQ